MKSLSVIIFGLFISTQAFAGTSQYVCKDTATNSDGNTSAPLIAATLNSMNCDTTKPINTTSFVLQGNTFIVVCCVEN